MALLPLVALRDAREFDVNVQIRASSDVGCATLEIMGFAKMINLRRTHALKIAEWIMRQTDVYECATQGDPEWWMWAWEVDRDTLEANARCGPSESDFKTINALYVLQSVALQKERVGGVFYRYVDYRLRVRL